MSDKKKIVLVVLENANIGDSIIADTCEYLLRNISPDAEIQRLNLFPDKKLYKRLNVRYTYTYPKWKQKWKFLKYKLYSLPWSPIYKFYKDGLKGADCVVFAGGGIIKHTLEAFWNPIYTIVKYCEKNKIPIFFDAVGIEGYDPDNHFSNVIKNTLNSDIIKKITTRDDIESLNYYVVDHTKTELVGDPALWTKETYSVEREDSSLIGIGLVRGKIFTDYGFDFTEEQIINSYAGIAKELSDKGYKWQFFCNGLESDYNMGLMVLERLGLEPTEEYIAKRPETSKDLVTLIKRYKGTISARLHANIVATSLGIPSIGLVWNNKLKIFGSQIGFEERFLSASDFSNAQFVVSALETALKNGFDFDRLSLLKDKTRNSLKEFITG